MRVNNNNIKRRMRALAGGVLAGLALLPMGGCNLMHDDLPDCPDGLDVILKYEYNLDGSDRFGPDVKAATVFVFDEKGKFVKSQEESDSNLDKNGYCMHIGGLAPGSYRLVVLAGDCDYNTMEHDGIATFKRSDIKPGDDMSKLETILEHDPDGMVLQNGRPLKVHYQSMTPVISEVKDVSALKEGDDMSNGKVNINLMRHTNTLKVTVYREEMPLITDWADFDVRFEAPNARITYDNRVDASSTKLVYTPYAKSYDTPNEGVKRAVAMLNFSRVMDGTARLVIEDRLTGITHELFNRDGSTDKLDINKILAEGMAAYPNVNDVQEYLDKQHDFEIDVVLDGEMIKYVDVSISVLNWSKRIQNVSF